MSIQIQLFVLLILIISCGKDNKKGESKVSDLQLIQGENQNPLGKYRAVIRPFNTPAHGLITSGVAEISINEKDMAVTLFMDDAAKVLHHQAIYSGEACPDFSSDSNGDGFVDFEEEKALTKVSLVELDSNLTSAEAVNNTYPSGEAYTYNSKAPFQDIMDQIYKSGKLPAGSSINLAGKVIIIRGAPTTTTLPSTLRPMVGMTSHASLAIACGIIERIE